jgi:hypothetical protein
MYTYVQVTKDGSNKGKKGTIIDPSWEGRVKMQMLTDGTIKSYAPTELTLACRKPSPKIAGLWFGGQSAWDTGSKWKSATGKVLDIVRVFGSGGLKAKFGTPQAKAIAPAGAAAEG